MTQPCDCCEGARPLTPQPTDNRPGLGALAYRVGTHAVFLETMKARLSSAEHPALKGLTTREADDPANALLDAWATVADVLTFYQERLANEGYLRTATERRSVLELARLVGYAPRPGVAATAYLAYTMEKDAVGEIPAGSRAQSVPGPGELPQSFETSEPIEARAEWNNLQPRMRRPQPLRTDGSALNTDTIYLRGTSTNLKPNDPLLFVFRNQPGESRILRRVKTIEAQFDTDRTKITLQEPSYIPAYTVAKDDSGGQKKPSPLEVLQQLVKPLSIPASIPPTSSKRLLRNVGNAFGERSDAAPQLLAALQPGLASAIYTAWANALIVEPPAVEIYALRTRAGLFGNSGPKKPLSLSNGVVGQVGEWPIVDDQNVHEEDRVIYLDASYDKIVPDSWVVVDTSQVIFKSGVKTQVTPAKPPLLIAKARTVQPGLARADYGMGGPTTRIRLDASWIAFTPIKPEERTQDVFNNDFQIIRRTVVYTQSEQIELAEEPIDDNICGDMIELDQLHEGLQSGRWAIVTGERSDIPGTSGVLASELVMIARVVQDVQKLPADQAPATGALSSDGNTMSPATPPMENLPGDKVHTTLVLATPLAYCYKRDSVTIAGNVVKATHGETRGEVLGAGDASTPFQSFTLRQPPLTYVSAPTESGLESTLEVRVNGVEWHEVESIVGLQPTDRAFVTRTADDGKTTVIFGDGVRGARLPTGVENVRAAYRNGIGKLGNVKPEQISLLATRPLGVKSVVNPLRASGGADKETRDQARQNATLATTALDRLVSVQDYADFARMFAGVGKASAARLSDGQRMVVHVTIAGAEDIPIDPSSDLLHNLAQALRRFGDPYVPMAIDTRQLLALVVSANVRLHPDYLWELVEPQIRAALLDTFSFARRELAQPAYLSEVISTIQAVAGVVYIDVDFFGSVSENVTSEELSALAQQTTPNPAVPARQAQPNRGMNLDDKAERILPAQLAYLTPAVPDTLILKELPL